jgi:hypothetical protein
VSHIVTIQTEVRNPAAVTAACRRLGLPEPVRGTAKLFEGEAAGLLDQSPAPGQASAPGPSLGQWFHYRGLVEADRNQPAYAERLLFRGLQAYQEARFEPGQAEVFDSLANLLLRRGHSRAALEFARRSLGLKEGLGDLYGQSITHGTVGRVLMLQARYDEAAGSFARSLEMARALGDERGISRGGMRP